MTQLQNKLFRFFQRYGKYVFGEKLCNTIEAGFVDKQEDYLYSSARDYVGINGKLKKIDKMMFLNYIAGTSTAALMLAPSGDID